MAKEYHKIGVLGAGSWGTSLALMLAKKGKDVTIWSYESDVTEQINSEHENKKYLSGFPLPENLKATSSSAEAVASKDAIIQATPSHGVRRLMEEIKDLLPNETPIINATKGIENDSLMTVREILEDVLPERHHPYLFFLSGPSFAHEVAKEAPTAIILAGSMHRITQSLQPLLSTPYLRIYTSNDIEGVEIGGALKNVVAIAAGAVEGMELGHNSMAALVTRGLSEITRLAVKRGANPITLSGLAGMGDLILTCYGSLSRNRQVGFLLGQGKTLAEIQGNMFMVAEGILTAKSVYQLSQKLDIEMPICESVYDVLYNGLSSKEALLHLLSRPHTQEWRLG